MSLNEDRVASGGIMGHMTLTTEHVTSASPARVWEVLSDLEGWPSWLPTVDTLAPLDLGPADMPAPGVGASYAVTQPKLPKAQWTITHWEPEHGFTWVSRAPGVTTTATHAITELPAGGSRISLEIDWVGPLAWVPRAAYGRLAQRYIDTEARTLAAVSES